MLWEPAFSFADEVADTGEVESSTNVDESSLAGNEAAEADSAAAEGSAADEGSAEENSADEASGSEADNRDVYKSYKRAADRYKKEINSYRVDLKHTVMTEYQQKLSSVDEKYAEKIASLRAEESLIRTNVIKRMEAFLARYGETHPSSADILFRLARLYYEKSDEEYLADMSGTQEHPDFTPTLAWLDKLQRNFPDYNQMDSVLYLRGYCLGQMERNEESRDAFMTLIAAYPDSPRRAEVLTRIGEYYFSKSQDAILGLGGEILWDEALKYYNEAVALGPDTSVYDRALYRKAWTEYYTEDYDGMIRDFIALVGYADKAENGSALRTEAIDFMAAALAEEDWDLSDDVTIDPDFGMKRFDKYLNNGEPFEAEVLRKFADTLMEQTRFEHAADAYKAYIERSKCAPDMPEVIRVYVAALTQSNRLDAAAEEQGRIESRIGVDTEWYRCQERNGNTEAIAAADAASQQALRNSIMAYHDRVLRAEETVHQLEETLDNPKATEAQKILAEQELDNAKKSLSTANAELAEITATFIKRYPDDEENYSYRYLLGQSYYYSGQYTKSIDAFMQIRDIENSRFQADAARYVADAWEYIITDRAQRDDDYVLALPLPQLLDRVNTRKMSLHDAPMSLLLSNAITSATKEQIDAEIETRKGGSVAKKIPDDVLKLVEAREVFSDIETKMGKSEEENALAPQYRYDNAMIYYNYGNFEEAEKRFSAIIDKSPSSQHASSAADIIIAEYELKGDLDKVAELSDMYAAMQLGSASSDDIVNSRFKDKKYNALFKKAFKLFDDKHYLEAAAEFIHIIDENPTFEHNNRALYNAAYAYEQMKHYDSAMQLYRRVLNEYGETEEAVNALYRIGVNAEKFFDFDTAVDSFMSLYNNKKPLYQGFKYRVNALRNAAKIKILIEDKKGAAQLLERYHKDFPGQSDAPQFLYEAGRQYAELGLFKEATKIFTEFRKKYSSDPSMRAYVIASYVIEADHFRESRKISDARTYYETARALYQNAPSSAGSIGRDNAAKAAFALSDLDYEEWKKVKFKGKMQVMINQLKEHMAEMKRIANQFAQVMTYNSPVWGIASRYAIARMMHELVNELEDIERPTDVRNGSDQHLAFLASMSDMGTGTRDEAIKMYQNAIDASKMAGISMEWTQKSVDGLKQLDRTASSRERLAQMEDTHSSYSLVTPSEFKRQEEEKAEAEAAAKAEAEAALKASEEGDK